jgi:hypothetical protein
LFPQGRRPDWGRCGLFDNPKSQTNQVHAPGGRRFARGLVAQLARAPVREVVGSTVDVRPTVL